MKRYSPPSSRRPAPSILAAALAALLASSCASLSKDFFLNKQVDAAYKAEAVASQGVAAYEAELEAAGDYTKVAEVRRYFEVALEYDPDNAKAGEYLDKVDGYAKRFVGAKLAQAERLLAKSPREEAEDYALIVALQSARAADSSNERVNKLLKEQKGVKDKLSAQYLERSLAAAARANPPEPAKGAPPAKAPSPAERESALSESYLQAQKALAVDPGNSKAAKARAEALGELEEGFASRAAPVKQQIAASKYDGAKASYAKLAAFDSGLGGAFAEPRRELGYQLYLSWAKSLEAKKDLTSAREKADAALALKRGDEALALRKRVVAAMSSIESDAAFEAALAELDRLIAKGDLGGAQRRAASLDRAAKDAARKAKLAERHAKLRAGIKAYYDRGVEAYRAENFRLAIEQLNVVVAIDSSYEQAAEYLEKAREKQKLVEQFK